MDTPLGEVLNLLVGLIDVNVYFLVLSPYFERIIIIKPFCWTKDD